MNIYDMTPEQILKLFPNKNEALEQYEIACCENDASINEEKWSELYNLNKEKL